MKRGTFRTTSWSKLFLSLLACFWASVTSASFFILFSIFWHQLGGPPVGKGPDETYAASLSWGVRIGLLLGGAIFMLMAIGVMPLQALAQKLEYTGLLISALLPTLLVMLLAGTVLGILVAQPLVFLAEYVLMTVLAGSIFWLIRRPDKDTTHATS